MLLLALLACSGPSPSSSPAAEATEAGSRRESGVVRHREWSQSVESWEAGGSDYFVLEQGEESIILRETEAVPRARLEALVGKTVTVTGAEAPYVVPEVDPTSSYPMGIDSQPMLRGGGIQVATITPE